MKAFILAAGNGTRLRPLTDSVPKCLVPIRGVPMLLIWLHRCRSLDIREVTINLHSHREAVREFLAQHDLGVSVRIAEEAELLGSAGTLLRNRAWLRGEDRFWIFYSDVLTSANFGPMLAFHDRVRPAATLGLYAAADPSSCGIATLGEGGIIRDFVEKPMEPKSDLAFSGVMIGTPAMLEEIPPISPVDIGFHLLPRLVGRMAGYHIKGYLKDIGTLAAYEAAQREWPGVSAGQIGESGQPVRADAVSADASGLLKVDVEDLQETSC